MLKAFVSSPAVFNFSFRKLPFDHIKVKCRLTQECDDAQLRPTTACEWNFNLLMQKLATFFSCLRTKLIVEQSSVIYRKFCFILWHKPQCQDLWPNCQLVHRPIRFLKHNHNSQIISASEVASKN